MAAAPTLTPRELAVRAERIDSSAWLDQVEAAPREVRSALGLAAAHDGELAMVRSDLPFIHFNKVMTLGCPVVADDHAFAAIDRFYAGRRHWVLSNDRSLPADLTARLVSRGYAPAGAWDRVVLLEPRPELWAGLAQGCELVDTSHAADWSGFVARCYAMPPAVVAWLRALIGRPGWIHAMRREEGRAGAPVVMTRSLFMAADGWAWLGIDAPVPGVMAPCHDDDARVAAALLLAATAAGARRFVTDIEQFNRARRGGGYAAWGALGFRPVHRRSLHAKG